MAQAPLQRRTGGTARAIVTVCAALIVGCEPVPEACQRMCESSLAAQEDCLDRDGDTWENYADRGWPDARTYLEACEMWAWEGRRLQRDAWWRGELEGHDDMAQTCASRRSTLDAEAQACESIETLGWNYPWEEAR